MFLIGLNLFGFTTMQASVLPRWAGLLLILGMWCLMGKLRGGRRHDILEIVGALITCLACVWLGLSLLSRSRASAGRVARVS